MAYTPVRLYQGQPTTSDAELTTSPTTGNRLIKQILLANTAATSASVTINLVPDPGTTASAANQIVPAVSVPGNSILTLDVTLVMTGSDKLRGLATGSGTSITVSIHGLTF